MILGVTRRIAVAGLWPAGVAELTGVKVVRTVTRGQRRGVRHGPRR
jgi:hypothetical protein